MGNRPWQIEFCPKFLKFFGHFVVYSKDLRNFATLNSLVLMQYVERFNKAD